MGEIERRVTLAGEGTATVVEKKSEFIGYACPVRDEQEAEEYIRAIRKKHADARHNVYAYMIGNAARCSDDGEPQGTAGVPVLEVIRKSGFTDAVIVVTRYFGGILLGAGGLVRAYSAAARAAVDAAGIVTMEQYDEISFACEYADYPKIERDLPRFGALVDGVGFVEQVRVSLAIRADRTDDFFTHLRDLTGGRVVPEKIGTRYDCAGDF